LAVSTEKPISALELSGGPFERGRKYGTHFKHLIAHLIQEGFYKELRARTTKRQLLRRAKRYAPFIEDYSPEIAEELKGLAEGSGRSYEEIIMINAYEEIDELAGRCTAFAATGNATKDGKTYLGQNWDGVDWEWGGGEFALLLTIKRNDGVNILNYTSPGFLSCAGLNSNGIGICFNTVPRLALRVGVPTYIIVADVLRQKTIGEALNSVLRAKRAGCFNFVITDETELYDVEGTPDDVDIAYADDCIAHANHFVSQKFYSKQDMSFRISRGSTFVRYNRMRRLLKQKFGALDLETCEGFLKDHVNYPSSICQHPEQEKGPKIRSLDSWIMVPAQREFWIAHGMPCEHEFQQFKF